MTGQKEENVMARYNDYEHLFGDVVPRQNG